MVSLHHEYPGKKKNLTSTSILSSRTFASSRPRILEFGYSDLSIPSGRSTLLLNALRREGFPVDSALVNPYSRLKTLKLALAARRAPKAEIIFLRNPYFLSMVRFAVDLKNRLKAPLVVDANASSHEVFVENFKTYCPGSRGALRCLREDHLVGKEADLLIVDTLAHGRYMAERLLCDVSKMHVVPVGSHFEKEMVNEDPDDVLVPVKQILFIASFIPLHGVEVIVEAAKLVGKQLPEIIFRFIGSGFHHKDTWKSVVKLPNIEILKPMPFHQAALEVKKAQIILGIFGSTLLTQLVVPFKAYAALAVGKPLITARTPAAEELLAHGVDCWLVPPGDPKALANAIVHLAQHPDLRQALARGARESYQKKFHSRLTVKPLVERLMTLVNSTNGERHPHVTG